MVKQKNETPEEKSHEKTSGGSEIEVHTEPVEVPEGEPETPPDQPEVGTGVPSGVNEALIETIARIVGKTMALVTKIPEMDFDEMEIEQLKVLWSPFVPQFSPKTMAILGTTVIVGGKVGTYIANRPKKPTDQTVESAKTKSEEQTIESQIGKEL